MGRVSNSSFGRVKPHSPLARPSKSWSKAGRWNYVENETMHGMDLPMTDSSLQTATAHNWELCISVLTRPSGRKCSLLAPLAPGDWLQSYDYRNCSLQTGHSKLQVVGRQCGHDFNYLSPRNK